MSSFRCTILGKTKTHHDCTIPRAFPLLLIRLLPSHDTRKIRTHHDRTTPCVLRAWRTTRARQVEADFLRDPARRDAFERGFAALAAHNLTFDLQCNPAQLGAAADLCARHPATRVVLDHLGMPRHLWMLKRVGDVGGGAA